MIFTDTLNGVAGALSAIMRTSDGGVTWRYDSTDFPNLYVSVFISGITEHGGVAAQAYGALARRVEDISDVVMRRIEGQQPVVSIHPNPISRSTPLRIRIDAGNDAEAAVSLDDILGRRVVTMTERSAGNAISCDISHLASGIYFVRVTVDGVPVIRSLRVL